MLDGLEDRCRVLSLERSSCCRASLNRCCHSPRRNWPHLRLTAWVKVPLWGWGSFPSNRIGRQWMSIMVWSYLWFGWSSPSASICWYWINRFVVAFKISRKFDLAVPCGAAVFGLRWRNKVGSKSCSSQDSVLDHLLELRMSQKPSREIIWAWFCCDGEIEAGLWACCRLLRDKISAWDKEESS